MFGKKGSLRHDLSAGNMSRAGSRIFEGAPVIDFCYACQRDQDDDSILDGACLACWESVEGNERATRTLQRHIDRVWRDRNARRVEHVVVFSGGAPGLGRRR